MKSDVNVTDHYLYVCKVVDIAKLIKNSNYCELATTSLKKEYLKQNQLCTERMSCGFDYWDTGTIEVMLKDSQFLEIIERRQDLKLPDLRKLPEGIVGLMIILFSEEF